jgi:DNA-binding beta-propeller fold protein YncE
MKFVPLLLFAFFGSVLLSAQDRVAVTFKTFPPEYEVFSNGERLSYSLRDDGLRTYFLPLGRTRVNLTAPGSSPLSVGLDVKAGMPWVQAKLEPRQGPLVLVKEAATGRLPRSVAFSADSQKLFVALQGEPGVDVYDVPSLKKSQRLVPSEGVQGGFTDVLVQGGEVWTVQNDGRIHAFDAKSLAFQDSHDLAGGGNAFLTDLGAGKFAVANWDGGQLTAIDAASRKAVASLNLGASLRGFAFRNGLGFASLFDRDQVAVLDGSTWKVKAMWNVGKSPRPVAVMNGILFVGDMGSAQVSLVDTASGKTVKVVPVPSNPHQMAVSADQTLVAVASRGRNNPSDYQLAGPEFGKVTLLDRKGEVAGAVWGRNQPTGLAFSPDGKFLAFTDFLDNNVELYRLIR